MPKIYTIYKCVNKINGKVYIGYTNKILSKRIIEHKSYAKKGSNYLLHKSIRKYGFESFVWEIIYQSYDQKYMLDVMENYFINEYNSYYEYNKGYNMTFGGQGGMTNKKHSYEVKEKMKLARSKRKIEPMLGKKHNDETRRKMSEKKKGKKRNDEYKMICSERNKKRYSDPEKVKILSDAIKLSWQKRKQQKSLGV